MGSITIGGLGSGLDVQSIVDALVQAERAPKQNSLDRLETDVTVAITGLGNLKSALSELRSSALDLSLSSNFGQRKVTTSSNEFFTASATSSASAGSYNIEVKSLAEGSRAETNIFTTGSSTTFGNGTLSFTVGAQTFDVEISASDTLEEIRNNINEKADNDFVSVNLLNNVNNGIDTGSLLSFDSTVTGFGNNLSVTYSGDAALADLADNLTQTRAASDASIEVDGYSATSDSNAFANIIQGVTINVTKANAIGETESLSVSLDKGSTKAKIESFVETFNAFAEVVRALGSADSNAPGILVGDYTLRQVNSQIRNLLSTSIAGVNSDFNSLSAIGIKTTRDGDLEIDNDTLTNALDNNFEDFESLFAGDQGLGASLRDLISRYTDSDGIITSRLDSLNNRLDNIGDERLSLNLRIESLETRLIKQFSAMDAAVAQFNSTQSFIAQQFQSLPGFGNNNKD